jgi:hypothetical protein
MAKEETQAAEGKAEAEAGTDTGEASGTGASGDKAVGKKKKENADAAKARKAAESVTDFHIEKEIAMKDAVAAVQALGTSDSAKKKENLFDGEIKAADVTTLVEECDMSKEQAERCLRQNQGVLAMAITSYLRQ